MSERATLARPYALALYKRAKETGGMERWSGQLSAMAGMLADEALSRLILSPKLNKQQLSALLMDMAQGGLDHEACNFLRLLVDNGRLSLLPHIVRSFEALRSQDEGYADVDVCVAYEFTEASWPQFVQMLEKALGKKVRASVKVDKSLIGGFLAKAGDKVIDGSIKGRLQHVHKTLK